MKLPVCAASIAVLLLGLSASPSPRAQAPAASVPATSLPQGPAAVRFAFGGNAAQIPAEFVSNLVMLPVHVNQSQPSLFELDSTAAVSSVDPGRASELGLPNPPVPVLNLPGVDVSFSSLPLVPNPNFSAQVGRPYEGTLGNDFLMGVVAEIDYARQTVQLVDPAQYKYSGHGSTLKMTFVAGRPAVQAKFNATGKTIEATFVVDTALGNSLLIYDHYADAHKIRYRRIRSFAADPEPDGTQDAVVARIRSFQIGQFQVQGPLALFSKQQAPDKDPRIAGEIGGGMMRRFIVVFNYAHQQMVFDPSSDFHSDDVEDMSGISLLASGPALKLFTVTRVRSGTPGSDAGIQKGDIIEGIGDEAAADLSLPAIHRLFRQLGDPYKLLISRNGKTLTLTLKLRHLL